MSTNYHNHSPDHDGRSTSRGSHDLETAPSSEKFPVGDSDDDGDRAKVGGGAPFQPQAGASNMNQLAGSDSDVPRWSTRTVLMIPKT